MQERVTADLCVIGGGPAGVAAARAAAASGVAAVLVDRGLLARGHLGGARREIATAAFLAAARHVSRAGAFGAAPLPKLAFGKIRDHVQEAVERAGRDSAAARLTALGVRVIAGEARFTDGTSVEVADAGVSVTARHFILATGAAPLSPPIPGLADMACLTEETIFDLNALPRHLLVVGAAPHGLALAQAFRRLGTEVTILAEQIPLATQDEECATLIRDALEAEGIAIRAPTALLSVGKARSRIVATFRATTGATEESVEATHLLLATARQAQVAELGLDRAGVTGDEHGIRVDAQLRTANKRIYAIGGVLGAGAGGGGADGATRADAEAQALRAVGAATGRAGLPVPDGARVRFVPTDPPLAEIGLSERHARAKRLKIRILRWPFQENDEGRATHETQGHIKVIVHPRGRILGVAILGAQAGDLIAPWALAMHQRLKIHTIAALSLPSPSRGETGQRAAQTYFIPRLTPSWPRRIIRALRIFG